MINNVEDNGPGLKGVFNTYQCLWLDEGSEGTPYFFIISEFIFWFQYRFYKKVGNAWEQRMLLFTTMEKMSLVLKTPLAIFYMRMH